MKRFDVIVIGSGQAGNPLAKKLAKAGRNVALVEKRFIGGTCINDGCTPTKTMIASAKVVDFATRSQALGINIPSFSVDLPAIVKRKDDIVFRFRNSSQEGLEETENLEIIFGAARFTGHKKLAIHQAGSEPIEITAETIVINTGAQTVIPHIKGLDTIPYLTSTTILDATEVPDHLVILGASYIGLEFGQMFKRFGSKVTMIDSSAHFLPREDRDVAECLQSILETEGLTFYQETKAVEFVRHEDKIMVTLHKKGQTENIVCSHVLIAVGRHPSTDDLAAEKSGVTLNESKHIVVNEFLETTQPGIFALGDVKDGPAFTHVSYNDHLIVLNNLLNKEKKSIEGRLVPYCMFTDPQLGRVGITETAAKKQGLNIKVAVLSMKNVARAIETGDTRGLMKAVVDANTKKILGVAIIGAEGGEIMSVLQLAMMGEITYEVIRNTMFAHPLYAESLNNLFMKLDN